MARVEEKIHKLKYPGAIDADGHILGIGQMLGGVLRGQVPG